VHNGGSEDYWVVGEANSIDFLLNGIPIEILQCPACNTHFVKKAGAIIFIAQVVDSDRYPLGDLFIFILNFSSLSDDHIFHLNFYILFLFFRGFSFGVGGGVVSLGNTLIRRYFKG
jgi:hypothetical protein